MMTLSSPLADDPKFEAFLRDAAASDGMPEDLAKQITAGLRKKYESPPVEAAEAVLRRGVGAEKLRELLYYPSAEDIREYPTLLRMAPEGAPEDHPQNKMQINALTTLYLAHGRRWELAKPFIEAGGLRALTNILVHPNLYLRGQAFQVLVSLQSEDLYPWHSPPKLPGGRLPTKGPDALVWASMAALSRSPLIANIIENSTDHFPGAAFLALRVLAFFCSWLRQFYCKGKILRLSQQLLDHLKSWSTREGAAPEELELAQKLYEDFSRFPAADAADGDAVLGRQEGSLGLSQEPHIPMADEGQGEGGSEGKALPEAGGTAAEPASASCSKGFDKSFVNHGSGTDENESEQAKLKGNAAFNERRWSAAVLEYSRAIDLPVPHFRLIDEGPRRSIYHSNRAAAYLARGEAGGGQEGESDDMGHLEGQLLGPFEEARQLNFKAAQVDCDIAIDLHADNVKARYRLAQSLKLQGRLQGSLDATTAALERAPASLRPQLEELRVSLLPCTDEESRLDELD